MEQENNTFEHCKVLISKNRISEVLDILLEQTQNDDIKNSIILKKSEFYRLEQEKIDNTISIDKKDIKMSQMNKSILDIIKKLEAQSNTSKSNTLEELEIPVDKVSEQEKFDIPKHTGETRFESTYIINSREIKRFIKDLNKNTKNNDIKNFILALGEFFRFEDPDNIEVETILRTIELLIVIHKKIANAPNDDLSFAVEKLLLECRAKALVLKRKVRNREFDEDYYHGISIMGERLTGLSNLL